MCKRSSTPAASHNAAPHREPIGLKGAKVFHFLNFTQYSALLMVRWLPCRADARTACYCLLNNLVTVAGLFALRALSVDLHYMQLVLAANHLF